MGIRSRRRRGGCRAVWPGPWSASSRCVRTPLLSSLSQLSQPPVAILPTLLYPCFYHLGLLTHPLPLCLSPRPLTSFLSHALSKQAYDSDSADLYDVLGVGRDCDETSIKAAFHAQALQVHPDKNRHPLAKRALDALVEARETLLSPPSRAAYDERLRRSPGRRPLTPRRVYRAVRDEVHNAYSRFLLLQHRLRHGRWREEADEAGVVLAELKAQLETTVKRFAYLDEWEERVALLNELWARHWSKAFVASLTIGCLV